jgi:hypothetical protein
VTAQDLSIRILDNGTFLTAHSALSYRRYVDIFVATFNPKLSLPTVFYEVNGTSINHFHSTYQVNQLAIRNVTTLTSC